MASDIRNIATVLTYNYFTGDREQTGGPVSDDAVNQYVVPTVHLGKVCSVDGFPNTTAADYNEVITLTYTMENRSGAPVTYTTITIQDAILTSPYISIVPDSETGGIHIDNTITVTPEGGLIQGGTATYSIKLRVISPSAPTNILGTTATGTFTTATGSTNLDQAICTLSYNHAELIVNKLSNPESVITIDQNIQYTIKVTNIGNVSATIGARQFQDPIPANTTFVSLDVPATSPYEYISTPNALIQNKSLITLAPGESTTVIFTVKAIQQP